MAWLWRTIVLVIALVGLLPGRVAAGQEATPVGSPVPLGAAECTVEARPQDELRALTLAGYEVAVAFVAGTPVAEPSPAGGAMPEGTPGTEREQGATPRPQTPADAATVAAATESLRQFVACSNAGNAPALAAVLDDDSAEILLGFAVVSFVQASTGTLPDPADDLDPALLDGFLAFLGFPVAPPEASQLRLYDIGEVTRLDKRRVLVEATVATGTEDPIVNGIVLREEDGRLVVAIRDEPASGSDAPAAATPVA